MLPREPSVFPAQFNSVDLKFKYYKAAKSFDEKYDPIELAFVQMTYFDFDSAEDGPKGRGFATHVTCQ